MRTSSQAPLEGSRDWIGLARGIYTPLDTFNKFLSFSFESSSRALKYPRHAMDGISWTDLDKDEQRTIAMLAEGVSTELCDPVALLTLKRIGFIKGSRLTLQAEQMLAAAVRRTFAAETASRAFPWRAMHAASPAHGVIPCLR